MSYGWQTQQTIIPQKPTKITVHNQSSVIGLKSVMLSMKSELASKPVSTNKPLMGTQSRHNKGVEQRVLRDALKESVTLKPLTAASKQVENSLRIKQKLYSEMQDKGSGLKESLVDFTIKKIDNDDDYQQVRKNFYQNKMDELQKSSKLNSQLLAEQQRDRINWEKKMFDELVNGTKVERSMVRQSYEGGMSNEEMQALKEVLIEKKQEVQRRQELKRKGKQLTEDRIRKLRKMNIIKDHTDKAES